MKPTENCESPRVIAETKYLRLVERGHWSYVQRTNTSRAVCIVAKTPGEAILLVEQFRPPVQKRVIELPAGLVGDLADLPDESIECGAARELIEETGYVAGKFTTQVQLASCPGLADETTTLVVAEDLRKEGPGGGDESEDILVHEVPLDRAEQWLAAAQAEGKLIDPRVYAGLYFLSKS
jgi:ADP-ribose pyrophosphatase